MTRSRDYLSVNVLLAATIHVIVAVHPLDMNSFVEYTRDQRSTNTFASYSTASSSYCGAICNHYGDNCFGFNFKQSSATCQLVSGVHELVNVTNDPGYTVYRRNEGGVVGDYVTLGEYNVRITTNHVQYAEASTTACAPDGRLIWLNTLQKFNTVVNYLISQDPVLNVWTEGYFRSDDGTWRFPDGSLLPIHSDPSILYSDELSPTCLRLKHLNVTHYQWRDCRCTNYYPYMCERLF